MDSLNLIIISIHSFDFSVSFVADEDWFLGFGDVILTINLFIDSYLKLFSHKLISSNTSLL